MSMPVTEEIQLPYKSVVLFIACGALIFAIVFIFAKRQITRFALKSNRIPHAQIGVNAPKSLKRQIEQQLIRVGDITYEPALLSPFAVAETGYETCQFYFRMKAVDALKTFDKELVQLFPDVEPRRGQHSLRTYLLEQQQHKHGSLRGIRLETIDKFAAVYEHARHDPSDFTQANYQEFMDLMNHLIGHMHKNSNQDFNEATNVSEYKRLETDPSLSDIGAVAAATTKSSESTKDAQNTLHLRHNVRVSQGSDIRNSYTSDAASSDSVIDTKRLGFHPHSDNEGETDLLLMEGQESGSSQGSLTETEVTFRQFRKAEGEESYV